MPPLHVRSQNVRGIYEMVALNVFDLIKPWKIYVLLDNVDISRSAISHRILCG